MFQKVLIAEDMDFINSGIKSELIDLKIPKIEYVQFCDEALLKLKCANLLDNEPFDLFICDLSFVEDRIEQKITSGDQLVEEVRKLFPKLKIIVFSVEDKAVRVQNLLNNCAINGYVWKNREGLRELKRAIQQISTTKDVYISPHIATILSANNPIEITDYDVFLIESLSKGHSQEEISSFIKEKKWSPTSISAIEKRLKLLKDSFNASNLIHLVAITKDLGLI